MKKIFPLFGALLVLQNLSFANSETVEFQNFSPEGYTIIKTNNDYSPLREMANTNAKRFSHLKRGVRIFSDYMENDFYRVNIGLDKPYWIEKKYADIETNAANKEPLKIEGITFYEDENFYIAKVKMPIKGAYNEIETSAFDLDFILYDTVTNKDDIKIENNNENFKISKDKFNNLKISYSSKSPLIGHDVEIIEDSLLLKVKKPPTISKLHPLRGITIILDAGHGGSETGACYNGLKEKDVNLQITKILAHKLKKQGAKVFLTREEDTYLGLYERVDFAKEKGGDFLISIHQNSLPDISKVNERHGVGVYYYNKEAYGLAKEIQKALVKGTKFQDDGVNFASFALTRASLPVCVLVECGYIIHPYESEKLSEEKFQKLFCDYLIDGIKNYLVENF